MNPTVSYPAKTYPSVNYPATSYPATFPQRTMYLQQVLHPDDESFDLGFVYRIPAEVDLDRFVAVAMAAIGSCPGFSTRFEQQGDGIRAIVEPGNVLFADQVIPATVDESAWVIADTERRIGLGPIAPGARVQAAVRFYRGAEASYMTIVCAHIVGDAYSLYRVIEVMAALYDLPDMQWPTVLHTTGDHPGTITPSPVLGSATASYRNLLAAVDTFENSQLATPRNGGAIRGRHLRSRLDGPAGDLLRHGQAIERFGAATVFFAAYAATLHRLTDRDTIVVGVPIANRAGHRAKRAAGYFVNTLPLPLTIDTETTWWSLCEQVKRGIRILQSNQGVDLAGAQRDLVQPGANFRGVDNAVTFYRQALVPAVGGYPLVSLPLDRSAISYPISLTIADDGAGYLLDLAVADHLGTSVQPLLLDALAQLSGDPQSAVIADSVWQRSTGNAADVPRSTGASGGTLIDRIDEIAEQAPDAVALRMGSGRLTYGELSRRMRAVAAALDAEAASRFVVVQLTKSVEAIVTVLGVMASGRAYVPIDPAAPPVRHDLIVGRVESEVSGRVTVLADSDLDRVGATGISAAARTGAGVVTTTRPGPADPAYVIFTSGSTGEPKGVVIPHSNMVDLLASTQGRMNLGPDDVWCLFHSIAFDFSVWEIIGPLWTGGTLVVPAPEEITNPAAFAQFLHRERITVLNQTPSAFRRLIGGVEPADAALPDLRLIVFGGESLYPADIRPWVEKFGSTTRFINMYGITETTVHVTYRELSEQDIQREKRSVIGRPLAHLGGLVVDRHGRHCPVGVPGELLVTGRGLAIGYLGRPDLTAQRFVLVTVDGHSTRAYRTGDKVSPLPDGDLGYIGRFDHQVQLRGYRIELGEIEAALVACDLVRAAVVRLIEPSGGEPFLAAWVSGPPDLPVDELRHQLADRVPPYMIPAAIQPVEQIPINQNGKPDLDRLPAPTARQPVRTGNESLAEKIADIWGAAIGAGRIAPQDRFMDVGGTSMHVMLVHRRLQEELGLTGLSLIDLFEYATPAELADFVQSVPDTPPVPDSHPVPDTHPNPAFRPSCESQPTMNGRRAA